MDYIENHMILKKFYTKSYKNISLEKGVIDDKGLYQSQNINRYLSKLKL